MIYFIQAKSGGPIKVGYAKGHVADRVKILQIGHPEELIVLAQVPGEPHDEFNLHQSLLAHHLRGEWFRECDAIADLIADARAKHDQVVTAKPQARLSPEQLERNERDEQFLREQLAKFLRHVIGERPGNIRAAAKTFGVNSKAVENWLAGKNLPQMRQVVSMAKASIQIRAFLELAAMAAGVAGRRDVELSEGWAEVLQQTDKSPNGDGI